MGKIPFKVGVTYCIYNEGQFLKESLMSVAKALDGIEFIHLLDGAWLHTGGKAQSTDRTKEVIAQCKILIEENLGVDIIFEQPDDVFRTQGDKRNECLRLCEEEMAKRDSDSNWYHIVIDGDELIKFPNGYTSINMIARGSGVDKLWPKIGSVKAFAFGSARIMWSPRFIPAFLGYHYHTEQRMVIHDKDCNVATDYNLDVRNFDKTELMEAFFIVNYWNKRNVDRSMMKFMYNQNTLTKNTPECKYENTFKLKVAELS